eukprot:896713-Prorocentrum_minimum.AAC.1
MQRAPAPVSLRFASASVGRATGVHAEQTDADTDVDTDVDADADVDADVDADADAYADAGAG